MPAGDNVFSQNHLHTSHTHTIARSRTRCVCVFVCVYYDDHIASHTFTCTRCARCAIRLTAKGNIKCFLSCSRNVNHRTLAAKPPPPHSAAHIQAKYMIHSWNRASTNCALRVFSVSNEQWVCVCVCVFCARKTLAHQRNKSHARSHTGSENKWKYISCVRTQTHMHTNAGGCFFCWRLRLPAKCWCSDRRALVLKYNILFIICSLDGATSDDDDDVRRRSRRIRDRAHRTAAHTLIYTFVWRRLE